MLRKFTMLIITLMMIVFAFSSAPASAFTVINAAAGGTGGSWYMTLASMAELNNGMNTGVMIKVMPGGGLANPPRVSTGEFKLAWAHSVLAKAAFSGKSPFKNAAPNIRTLATGFNPHMVQITALASSNIKSFDEIFKKKMAVRFCTGVQSTITGWLFNEVLKIYGVTVKDIESWGGKVIFTNYGDWVTLAQDKQIDVMFDVIGVPASTTREINTTAEQVILEPSEKLAEHLKTDYGFIDTVITPEHYSFLKKNVKTVGTGIELIVNKDVSDEDVTKLLQFLYEKENDINKIHSSLSAFSIKNAWNNSGCPLHPAALKFYKENGYIK